MSSGRKETRGEKQISLKSKVDDEEVKGNNEGMTDRAIKKKKFQRVTMKKK